MIPNGTPNLLEASLATNCPTRVTLKAVFLIVSQRISKFCPRTCSKARFTTPGPDTPTLMIRSASVTPWNAPAINGLSSGALQNTTNLAGPIQSRSAVSSALSFTISPINLTASILIPVLVEPTLTLLHTNSVTFNASGIERINISSYGVIPFETKAEYPPIKFTPTVLAARSNVLAISI
ncbi:unknown [Clostridium sp. CAG:590]|nr:unknown [Clostridium sp. CAG:590]